MRQIYSGTLEKCVIELSGAAFYAEALKLEKDYEPSAYKKLEDAAVLFKIELAESTKVKPAIRNVLLESLYDCYQRLWTEAEFRKEFIVEIKYPLKNNAAYYEKRTLELAEQLGYKPKKPVTIN